MTTQFSRQPEVEHAMRHFVILKRALVIGLYFGFTGPTVAELAVRAQKQSPQHQPRGTIALGGMVAGNVIQIAEEKTAQIQARGFTGFQKPWRQKGSEATAQQT